LYYSTNLVEEQGRFSEMNFCCQKYSLSFPRAQPVLPQGRTAIFVADASVFGVFAADFNFSHLKGEELTVIHLYKNALHNSREPSLDKPAKRNYTTNREGAVRNGQLPPANWSIRRMTAHRLETGAVISYCYGSL
jgi:hypothetical protein